MVDLCTVQTVEQDVPETGSTALFGLAVKGGIPILKALENCQCHLDGVLDLLGTIAVESSEKTSDLYSVLTQASIAKALVDAVVTGIYRTGTVKNGVVQPRVEHNEAKQ